MASAFSDPLFLILLFVAFWFGGAALMSRIAGWHVLSALYPPQPHRGVEYRFCTANIGPGSFAINYRRCVGVSIDNEGLGFRLMFPFKFYSPPFRVPWAAVTGCTEKQVLLARKVTLSFAGTDRQVTLAGELGQWVKAQYQKVKAGAA